MDFNHDRWWVTNYDEVMKPHDVMKPKAHNGNGDRLNFAEIVTDTVTVKEIVPVKDTVTDTFTNF